MATIAQATVTSLTEKWGGTITSGQHTLMTDKPESLGGQIGRAHV